MTQTHPAASSASALARMVSQRRRDTAPEVELRRALHRLGLRFRIHVRPLASLRREADVLFTARRIAVFVDGCWWHGCPQHHAAPAANRDWWAAKIRATRARDSDTDRQLGRAGWTVVRVWEHEEPDVAAGEIERIVRAATRLSHPKTAVGTNRVGHR